MVDAPHSDDLSREVFGLLGVPVDAIDFPQLLRSIEAKARGKAGLLISTPNVNFMVKSQDNPAFRELLLCSSLCLIDGMPLIWIAKLLDIPVTERIAGADLFGRLKSTISSRRPLRVFLVGGSEGVAAKVGDKINAVSCGLRCVGALNPGFGTVEEISKPHLIDAINASEPDIVAVFFGAEKAQAWLMHNADKLKAPIRAQFGATINFEAGLVKRAPWPIRSSGFEWLWRIKEEPYLWRRYLSDGKVLLRLFLTSVLPLIFDRLRKPAGMVGLSLSLSEGPASVTLHLAGDAVADHVDGAIAQFRKALGYGKPVTIDLSQTQRIRQSLLWCSADAAENARRPRRLSRLHWYLARALTPVQAEPFRVPSASELKTVFSSIRVQSGVPAVNLRQWLSLPNWVRSAKSGVSLTAQARLGRPAMVLPRTRRQTNPR